MLCAHQQWTKEWPTGQRGRLRQYERLEHWERENLRRESDVISEKVFLPSLSVQGMAGESEGQQPIVPMKR
jgi:hypothetical protein